MEWPAISSSSHRSGRTAKSAAHEAFACEEIQLEKCAIVIIITYLMQRRADLYPDPLRFLTDHFLDAGKQSKAPGRTRTYNSYLPFGAGPRACVGAQFATMEATLVLGLLATMVEFEPRVHGKRKPAMLITLRPDKLLPVRIRQRVRASGTASLQR